MKITPSRFALALLLAALLPIAACGSFGSGLMKAEEPPPPQGEYLEFKDVKIPSPLKLDRQASFVYESNGVRAGVLTLTGKFPVVDVLDFFQTNMPRDGWALLSSFKYQKNILIYTKPDKVCLVVAAYPYGDEALRMEVWVAPIKPGQSVPGVAPGESAPFQGTGDKPLPLIKTPAPKEETLPPAVDETS